MRFSIQSIKKLVTTGTWKIGGTWDAIGFVGLAMGVAVCLVDSRSFAIACLAAVKSRGGERQFTRQRYRCTFDPLLSH